MCIYTCFIYNYMVPKMVPKDPSLNRVNSKGNNVALCKHRVDKSVGSIIEIISLCKETNFGKHQIFSRLVMYQPVFLSRLIYNCESWSNLTQHIKIFQTSKVLS